MITLQGGLEPQAGHVCALLIRLVNLTPIAACHPVATPRAIAYEMKTAAQGHGTARAAPIRPFRKKKMVWCTARVASLPVTAHLEILNKGGSISLAKQSLQHSWYVWFSPLLLLSAPRRTTSAARTRSLRVPGCTLLTSTPAGIADRTSLAIDLLPLPN